QDAVGGKLPTDGRVFISVANRDKRGIVAHAKRLTELGFELVSTGGTADVLARNGIDTETVDKITSDADRPGETILDQLEDGRVDLVVNTPSGSEARGDGYEIRAAANSLGVPIVTTLAAFGTALQAIQAQREYSWDVTSLQEHDRRLAAVIESQRWDHNVTVIWCTFSRINGPAWT